MKLAKADMDATARNFKVLVADDSSIYRKLVEHALAEKQYAVLFAKSGREAIDLFSKHQPSLVTYTYLIILTGITEKNKLVKGLAAGADDYLTKPFHSDELLARVGVGHRIVELHRQLEAKNLLSEELALTDPLTGLPNRRAIEERATRQLSGRPGTASPFWWSWQTWTISRPSTTRMDMMQVTLS